MIDFYAIEKTLPEPDMVTHTLDPSTLKAEEMDLCESEVSPVYIVSSRIARTS